MRLSAYIALIGCLFQHGVSGCQNTQTLSHDARQLLNLDQWLTAQEPIAVQGVLDNIGSQGSKVEGAADGVVVASPSKSEPDCEFVQKLSFYFVTLGRRLCVLIIMTS